MLDRIERDVRFEGPLSAEQHSRLLEIANKCPVHRTQQMLKVLEEFVALRSESHAVD